MSNDVWASDASQEDGSSNTYDREMAERNWSRIQGIHGVVGYKDGVIEGKEAHIQAGFDRGYAKGFNVGHELGRFQGILAAILQMSTKDAAFQQLVFRQILTDADIQTIKSLHVEIQAITADNVFSLEYYKKSNAADATLSLPAPPPQQTSRIQAKLVVILKPLLIDSMFVSLKL
ncbi:hypothetical protein BASA50_000517 [Batrachochytrium salamandrivorans]|uniref:Protein YAE1 n=1 Tax=Batrachochytrium salamandrivorans TaxID=1357716 RepID=A0ABQ8EWL0_9FUNG|nr:hypothetical protein BASA50_000517 [Batrachochytrium salamandrivorans]KAH9275370.1 hypothetical protein BASA83_002143 [Batrachochytrium salamandrivorans]